MCAFVILASSSTPLPVWPVMLSVATALQREARIARLVQLVPSRWTGQMSVLLPVPRVLTNQRECVMLATQPVQHAPQVILSTVRSVLPPPSLGSVVLPRIRLIVSRPVLPQPLLCPMLAWVSTN